MAPAYFPSPLQVVLNSGDLLLLVGRPEDYSLEELAQQFEVLDPMGWREAYTGAPGVFLIEAVLTHVRSCWVTRCVMCSSVKNTA